MGVGTIDDLVEIGISQGAFDEPQNYNIVYIAKPKRHSEPYAGYPNRARQEHFVLLLNNPGVVDVERTPGAYGTTSTETMRITRDPKNTEGDIGQWLETGTHE